MTIDANIAIAYLNGDPAAITFIQTRRAQGLLLLLPTVAESEVLSFPDWTSEELQSAERFLEENFTSIAFDRTVAKIAAEIRRQSKIKFPDAAIAATALFTHTPLVTRNQRDFKKIAGLDIVII